MTVWTWVDLALCVALLPVAVACGYLLLLTVLSWRRAAPVPPAPTRKFDVVIPSHNEELGIARTVANLSAVDYPASLRRILVIADNCSDATAEKAREAGATVLERHDTQKRGKGYALAHAFEFSQKDGFADAVVVVDADTVVSPNLLHAYGRRLEDGAHAVQAHYGVMNPTASWRTRLMTIALGMFHKVRSLGREALGVSCGLRGNGMCFTHAVLREVPHDAFSVVEDLEYGIRLGRKGHRVHYAWEAEVQGEMVSAEKQSRSQRQRWEGGRAQMRKLHGWPLLSDALKQKSGLLLDLSMDVLVPPLSQLVLAAVGSAVAASVLVWLSGGTAVWASAVAGFALASLGAYVLRGWWVSGVGPRGLLDLAWAPVYVVWKVGLMLRGPGAEKRGEWVRTEREAERR
ncbi:Glycosyltransferase, catalytic subunit of cellulose synthase and poly-beta-1,6-N-acetylglucosamine synthase [Myxococcus fulvus]|uniref:Glycosyl transferase n=1 Tax=Myxococcus fulvus TaxID=33 RepID=A0A511TAP5_MYXFU|nr:exopolysaccharide biosynthesis GT2 family glycosyltransferase EpsU [Myxococcus fulvus]GEN11250.1 glycosyl transferase [Myxococcus fulvus]SEU39510.1 Glycosyltransferase, catalytic subunit of cellulose synthase and poly-beta-1,6-N-acetylglucosamine synthase [Myxococcus fulvus]